MLSIEVGGKMLSKLYIKDVGIIEEITIDFESKFNVLSGETGSGKSLIIDSISSILGERTSRELIRTGCDKAILEALFFIKDDGLVEKIRQLEIDIEDSTLIISREFYQNGRNICKINGRMVTMSYLKKIGELLIDIHGQYDNISLLNIKNHIILLDSFAGDDLNKLKAKYTNKLEYYKKVQAQIESLHGDPIERQRKLELLEYQLEEIENINPKENEDETLMAKRNILANSQRLTTSLNNSYEILSGNNKSNVINASSIIIKELSSISTFDERYDKLLKSFKESFYNIEENARELRFLKDDVEYDPKQIELIDERLDNIFKLKRKYGSTINDVLKYKLKLSEDIEQIQSSDILVEKLIKEKESLHDELYNLCDQISKIRTKAAKDVEQKITAQLQDLEMKKAIFNIDIKFDNENIDFTWEGLDRIEFLISPNPGEPLKPLAKIASGGEMSRIMLAIKTVLADVDKVPVLIFDEIDTGISGSAGIAVAEKLAILSRTHQVICVTHLASICAMADNNYLIKKLYEQERTKTIVQKLEENEALGEIARLLSGKVDCEITKKHAEQLKNEALSKKQGLCV